MPFTALAVSPTQPLLAVSGRKQVVLFDAVSRTPLDALAFPEGEVFALQFSRDGKLLFAGGGVGGLSGKVVVYDVAAARRINELGDEPDDVLALAVNPDASMVALGGPGRVLEIFNVSDGKMLTRVQKHTDWILSVAFSPDGLLLASSDRFGAVQVWEADSGKEFHTLRGHVGAVHASAGWPIPIGSFQRERAGHFEFGTCTTAARRSNGMDRSVRSSPQPPMRAGESSAVVDRDELPPGIPRAKDCCK